MRAHRPSFRGGQSAKNKILPAQTCAPETSAPHALLLLFVRCHNPNVWSNSSYGIGSVSKPALCNNRSCPTSAVRFAVWSNSSSGIASNSGSGAASRSTNSISSGCERAGAIAGALVGSPTCSSICRTVAGSVPARHAERSGAGSSSARAARGPAAPDFQVVFVLSLAACHDHRNDRLARSALCRPDGQARDSYMVSSGYIGLFRFL